MRQKSLDNAAFSLLEILLSAVIFVVSIAGIFATLNAVRMPVYNKENALTATVFGKQALEALRSKVNASSSANYYSDTNCDGTTGICTDFSLALGTHEVTSLAGTGLSWPAAISGSNSCSGTSPCLYYVVSCADGSGTYGGTAACSSSDIARKVDLTINWPSLP
ncbi:MAG: hypothetical protein KGK03_08140 [Candidatus Omnitrophica bacterium]|nr:hypothetical protein [Candidatus Omnitrophota bacterium]MDE2223025.1 hypothetical protein [Candidatus Omnitrophota bacterium]